MHASILYKCPRIASVSRCCISSPCLSNSAVTRRSTLRDSNSCSPSLSERDATKASISTFAITRSINVLAIGLGVSGRLVGIVPLTWHTICLRPPGNQHCIIDHIAHCPIAHVHRCIHCCHCPLTIAPLPIDHCAIAN